MYGKVFASLYQGTLRGQSNEILVFTNLLAHADKDGFVDKHFRAIAEETGLDVESVKQAIINLESPDPESRSPEEEGARIVRLDEHRVWGWRIVNHVKYRNLRNQEDRREQNRIAQERWRNKRVSVNNKNKPSISSDNQPSAQSAHAEAEAEAEAEAYKSTESVLCRKPSASAKAPTLPDELFFEEIKRHYPDIDVDRELGKMRAFFLTPKAKCRKMTRRFVVGWLNRCDVPIKSPGRSEPKSMANGYYPKPERTEQPISLEEQEELARQFSELKSQMNGAKAAE